ncbi:MAG: hypothetical protein U5K55_00550 [Aliarcobacter sp.]|nr:hypothetical protein [Aliarcobacter sp.]
MDGCGKLGMQMQRDSKGGEIVKLDSKAMAEFNKAGEQVVQRWVGRSKYKKYRWSKTCGFCKRGNF